MGEQSWIKLTVIYKWFRSWQETVHVSKRGSRNDELKTSMINTMAPVPFKEFNGRV
jgi:hypothetical protein